jgi:hypothetical protein
MLLIPVLRLMVTKGMAQINLDNHAADILVANNNSQLKSFELDREGGGYL